MLAYVMDMLSTDCRCSTLAVGCVVYIPLVSESVLLFHKCSLRRIVITVVEFTVLNST